MNKGHFIRNKGGLRSLLNGMQSFLDQKKQYTSPFNKDNTSNPNKINKTIKIKSEIRQMYQQFTGSPRGNEVLTNNNFFTNATPDCLVSEFEKQVKDVSGFFYSFFDG